MREDIQINLMAPYLISTSQWNKTIVTVKEGGGAGGVRLMCILIRASICTYSGLLVGRGENMEV